jgi:hypothetical protein
MFVNEVVIGSIKAQANRLNSLVGQLEIDNRWKDQRSYYASEIYMVEKSLRDIRKLEFEHIYNNS